MKLELTLSKEILSKKFDLNTKYDNCRGRINKHTLVVSNELYKIWETNLKELNLDKQFQQWFFSHVGMGEKIKKVKVNLDKFNEIDEYENKVIIATADASKDNIIITNNKKIQNPQNFLLIGEEIFCKEKQQILKVSDIENVFSKRNLNNIFDIYETPINITVSLNSSSSILSELLSVFYKDSKKIIIKDGYLINKENQMNLKKYILPYIEKENCEITFCVSWQKDNKQLYERTFNNYEGYKTIVKSESSLLAHPSYIETDKYIINLGYRLKVFGDKNDGLTEHENVFINKK